MCTFVNILNSIVRLWNKSEVTINDLEKPTRLMKRSVETFDSSNNQQPVGANDENDVIASMVIKGLMRLWNKKELKPSSSQI